MTPFDRVVIDTDRLQLRPLTPADADDLFGIFSDAVVMRYWSAPPWTDRAQARQMIEADRDALAARRDLRLGLVLRDSGCVIGTVSL